MEKIKRALVSVSDKTGVAEFAKRLAGAGVEIVSTGGTAKELAAAGIKVTGVEEVTNSPEILGGRVKTLHPKIHGGILGIRDNTEHAKQMEENAIAPIDMVVVNLYPFEKTVAKPDVSLADAIENIDIGGPAMVRAAAKNHRFVTVVTDPADYGTVADEIERKGGVSDETRARLALKAFSLTAGYDSAISAFLAGREGDGFPERLSVQLTKRMDLRYGENPHQKGAFYTEGTDEPCVSNAEQIQGRELSLNNICDTDSAFELVKEFDPSGGPACVIVKHNNPCGVALGKNASEAFTRAKECDPVSAFGGVVALNCKADEDFAARLTEIFVEAVIAPGFTDGCLKTIAEKPNIRILKTPPLSGRPSRARDIKKVTGGALVQDVDAGAEADFDGATCPTKKQPSSGQRDDLMFAWKVCKHVKSNAIVFAKDGATVGIGAGQMSRVDSVRLAAMKAQSATEGCVMASDAFFPFRDGIDEAAKAGIAAAVHPGGSVRDEETTAAADGHGMAVLLTGVRHFRH